MDGAFVEGQGRGRIVDFGNDRLPPVGAVHDHEIAVCHRAQVHRLGRVAVGDPFPALSLTVEHATFGQHLQPRRRFHRTEGIAVDEGQLEGRAADMVHQDQRLVGFNPGLLRAGIGKEFRVTHHVLVQRLGACDQHPNRRLLASTGAAKALPSLRNRSGIAVEYHDIQAADVHAKLKR